MRLVIALLFLVAATQSVVVYLGPEPDKDMTGSLPLTAAQKRELERRDSITSDPQRSMRARYLRSRSMVSSTPKRLLTTPELI